MRTVKEIKETIEEWAAYFVLHEHYSERDCDAIRTAAGDNMNKCILLALKLGYIDGHADGFGDMILEGFNEDD